MPVTKLFTHEEVTVLPSAAKLSGESASWYTGEYEGQLAVDVYQTQDELVVRSTIAGVKPEDLEITLNDDVITLRGKRYQETEAPKEDYFYQECYWGGFSRSIVLPMEVRANEARASLKNGVLTVVLPKAHRSGAAVAIGVEAAEED
ncbi:MAG: Hsp20/alpha crystallin family protein [Candidatus Veblenbacteria bacterium]|nr:Hsp20/alpha crystallin family protein [Candidatus Veblenbacteria bacterium]MDZ4229713.1 Hsp20/alpha crystallin family protein [Candidatus Veblenbacteria bacterium]